MKKIFIYILFSFIISNISFAKKSGCTDGDCNNGFGTWTYTDKTTYVGQWENGSKKGKGIESWPNGYVYEGDFNESKAGKELWTPTPRNGSDIKYSLAS